MDRRSFLVAAAAAAIGEAAPASAPAIDTHMHLFDPERPQGVPWPPKRDPVLYRPALPARYREVSAPFRIAGAIAVECSPWLEDNQWLLDTAAQDPIFVAVVGNLEIGAPDFRPNLERFARNPLFRGLRYGNLWGRNLSVALSRKQFIEDLRFLARAGLSLDTADPDPALLAACVRLSDLVPELRLILDHLPGADPPSEPSARKLWYANLRELAPRPQVYVKVSHLLRRVKGKVPRTSPFTANASTKCGSFSVRTASCLAATGPTATNGALTVWSTASSVSTSIRKAARPLKNTSGRTPSPPTAGSHAHPPNPPSHERRKPPSVGQAFCCGQALFVRQAFWSGADIPAGLGPFCPPPSRCTRPALLSNPARPCCADLQAAPELCAASFRLK
jgi:L-fuconolactonase